MMMHLPMFVLDKFFENQEANLAGCPPSFCRPAAARSSARACAAPRTTTAQAPKAQLKPAPQQPTDTIRRANLRDLADSYLIWADLPGLAREDVSVTVKDDVLHITGRQKERAADGNTSSYLQASDLCAAALAARPRRAVDIRVPLKSDARLEGIHAKLTNGELTIIIPKRVPQQFSINVLGADDPPSTSAGSAAAAPAELAAHLEPAQDTPAPAAEPSIADVPLPDFLEATQEAKENSEAPAAKPSAADSDACAPAAEPSAETAAAIADMHKRAADEEPESDGSWEDVSDEERTAERSARRRKGALPPTGPVLEAITDAQQEPAASQ